MKKGQIVKQKHASGKYDWIIREVNGRIATVRIHNAPQGIVPDMQVPIKDLVVKVQ